MPDDLVSRQALLAHLKAYSVKIKLPGEAFRLASGGMSRLYIDAKRTTLHRQMHMPLGRLLQVELARFPGIDAVAGIVLGGAHLASLAAAFGGVTRDEPNLDVLYVRRHVKDHGTGHAVEAPWSSRLGGQVVVLEDVLSTGASVQAAIAALREGCYRVVGIVALLDRRPRDVRTDELDGVPLRCIFSLDDLELPEGVADIAPDVGHGG